jgi:putative AdoMet-dependent methyltransferase
MSQEELQAEFDEWARTYDQDVNDTSGFPFAGYAQALTTVWELAAAEPGMTVLDLGVGTGNLARLFAGAGCQVLGADFSPEMLARTREKLPGAALVQVDLTLDEWPDALERRFERIVSNYTFHEFSLAAKVRILTRLARNNLARNGRIVIGDITFPTLDSLNRAREQLGEVWEEEYYWSADETREALEPAGWGVEFHPVSFCAGVFVLDPPADLTPE